MDRGAVRVRDPDMEGALALVTSLAQTDDLQDALAAFESSPPDGTDATTARLQQYVKDRLLPHKYPRIVEFVADLPKTGTGKIDRQALRSRDGEEGR